MARIAETEIERLKNEISVERLVEASGIELKKTGKVSCPHRPQAVSHAPAPIFSAFFVPGTKKSYLTYKFQPIFPNRPPGFSTFSALRRAFPGQS